MFGIEETSFAAAPQPEPFREKEEVARHTKTVTQGTGGELCNDLQ